MATLIAVGCGAPESITESLTQEAKQPKQPKPPKPPMCKKPKGALADCPADYSCETYGSLCCFNRTTCADVCTDCAPPECFGENPSAGACTNDSPCFPGFCDFATCTPSSCFCDVSGGWACTDDCAGHCTSAP